MSEHVNCVPIDDPNGNAMWRYFGLTKRGGPAEAGSLEAKVDLLLDEVTKQRLKPVARSSEERYPITGIDLIITALITNV